MGVTARLRRIGSAARAVSPSYLVNIGFAAALVVLVVIAVASYRSIERLRGDVHLVEHTLQVRSAVYELLARCADARIAWRNFLTDSPGSDMGSFDAVSASIDQQLDVLKALTADNALQQKRLAKFDEVVERDLATMRDTLRRKAEGALKQPGDILNQMNATKLSIPELAALAREMGDEEQSLLVRRREESDESAARTILFIILGNVGGLAVLVVAFELLRRDIVARRHAEKQLQNSNAFLDSVLQHIPNMVFVKDAKDLRFVRLNKAGEELLGYTRDELIGKNDYDFFPPKEADFFTSKDKDVLARGTLLDIPEEEIHTRGGQVRLLHTRKIPLLGADGTPQYLLGISEDITLRKRAEHALRVSEERLRLMVENVVDYAIFMLDPSGRVVSWNAGAERIKGYKSEEIIGQHFGRFYPPEAVERGVPQHGLAVATAQGRFEDIGLRVRKDGTMFWADIVVTALRDENGVLRGFAKITRDLTERRRMELLEQEGRHMQEFIAMLAHELRNPLAPIRNATNIMRMKTATPTQLAWCREVIDRQVVHLTRLVEDLLDISRVTTGKIKLDKEPLDIGALVANAVESSRTLFDAKRHMLAVELPTESLRVYADMTRLSQVVLNLLNNAAKYTPEGGRIRVSVEREAEQVAIKVRDNGIGIPAQLLDKVFDLFVQGDRALDRAEGGLGIGLTLVQRIVAMHAGTVIAASAGTGQGSEFVVRLPIVRAGQHEPAAIEMPDPRRQLSQKIRHVLVVDDNKDSAESMATLLRLSGHEVSTAHDGPAALSYVAARRPEIVLLDIGLPGMTGYDVAKQMRALPGLGNVRLVAMTGYGQEEDRRRTGEAGFDSHLVKPLSVEDVAKIIG